MANVKRREMETSVEVFISLIVILTSPFILTEMFCIVNEVCVSKLYLNVPEPDSIRLLTALPCMALWFPLGNLYSVLTAQREWKSIIWHKERDLHLILNKFEGIGFLFMVHCLYLWGWFSYMQFYLFSSLGWKKHVKTILTERCTQSLKGFSCHILCPREGMKSAW